MKNILLILLALIPFLGITQGKTIIKIKAKKSKGNIIYLQKAEQNKQVVIDSAKFNFWGTAKLQADVKETGFYQVSKTQKEGIPLILKGEETIKIKTSIAIIKDYSITGSKDSELLHKYFGVKNNKDVTKDSLVKYAGKFIERNNKSLALFIALGDIKERKKYFTLAEKGIGETYPNTQYHQALQQAVKALNAPAKNKAPQAGIGVGSKAPELNMPSPAGEIITLESLRGKYVLIDFWASWCGPCRRENPTVVKAYNKYKEAGFEVYSVSLDKDKVRWEQAIKQDGLIWPSHVSDLKQWRSAATGLYGFSGIPYTVLIDKDGKIIATRLRGPQLEAKLAELFGF
jgi:thiol-disulfide isomerase/thioredoxin